MTSVHQPLISLFFVLMLVATAGAQSLMLDNFVLDNAGDRIQVTFGLQTENVDVLRRSLDKGGPLRMTCSALLRRQRDFWPDRSVVQKVLSYDLRANPLTQTYILVNRQNNSQTKDEHLRPLLQKQWGDIVLDLGSWRELSPGADYVLDLTVQFKRPDVPQWLKKALFFWSWDVVSTKTYRMHFTY